MCPDTPPLASLAQKSGFVKCLGHLKALAAGSRTCEMTRESLRARHSCVQERHLNALVDFLEERKVGKGLVACVRHLRPWIVGDAAESLALALDAASTCQMLHLRDPSSFYARFASLVAQKVDMESLDEAQLTFLGAGDSGWPATRDELVAPIKSIISEHLVSFLRGMTLEERLRSLSRPLKGLRPNAELLDTFCVSVVECSEELADPGTWRERRLLSGRHECFRQALFPSINDDAAFRKKPRNWTLPVLQEIIRETWAAAASGTSTTLAKRWGTGPTARPRACGCRRRASFSRRCVYAPKASPVQRRCGR